MNSLLQNKRNAVALGAVGVAAVLAAAWFLVIAPQRTKAADLEQDVATAQQELATRRAALASPSAAVKVKASDLYRLTKALPDTLDMAGVLLDVNRLAAKNGLEFVSLLPGEPQPGTGYVGQPLSVVVQGRFGAVSTFLGDIRKLVRVRKGRLDARGRAYSPTEISITEADGDVPFPNVKATVSVNSYTFQTPPPASADGGTDNGATSPDGTVAAGVTP